MRRAVEELHAERTAAGVARKAFDVEVSALETSNDVLGRALGAATKQLYKQRQLVEQSASPAAKPRPPSATKRGGKTAGTPTGGALRQAKAHAIAMGSGGRGLPW